MNDRPAAAEPIARRRGVVFTFRQLPLRLLGCYGSAMCQTPYLDRLAATGTTFDNHFIDDLRVPADARDWWTGTDPADRVPLAESLRQAGIGTVLVTDQTETSWVTAYEFDERKQVPIASGESSEGSRYERLLRAARETIDQLESSGRDWLLWIHSSEFESLPLPPREFLELYLDELIPDVPTPLDDDEPTPDLSEQQRADALGRIDETVGRLSLPDATIDAGDTLVFSVLAAALMSSTDRAIGQLVQELDQRFPETRPLVMLTAERGFSLQEDQVASRLNPSRVDCPIVEELVHLPLLVRTATDKEARRVSAFTQPMDVAELLRAWAVNGQGDLCTPPATFAREQVILRAEGWIGLRDHEWLLLRSDAGEEQLFVIPDDRWQTLNVIDQSVDRAEELRHKLTELTQQTPSST